MRHSICSISFLFLLLMISCCVSSSSQQPSAPGPEIIRFSKNYKKGTTTSLMMRRNNKIRSSSKNDFDDSTRTRRTFSAMLPKGFVPPSGSSPCHNQYPNSVTFFCDLISTRQTSPRP